MAHMVNPYNLDDDDDAVFSALLSEGLIWVEEDDDTGESEIEYLKSSREINVHTLSGHTDRVNGIAVSGDFAISASSDKTLRVWNWKTGKHLRTLSGHTDRVNGIAVSGDFAISASSDKTLRVWNWKTGKHLRTLSDCTHELSAVALDDDIVFAVSFGEVWIWNWQTAENLRKLAGWHRFPVMSVAVDGDFVLSVSSDLLLVRNWKTGENHYKSNIDWDFENTVVYKDFVVFINDESIDVCNWKTGEELSNSDLLSKKNSKINKKAFLTPHNVYIYSRETNKWYLYNLNSETSYSDTVAFVEDYSHIIRGNVTGRINVIRPDSSLQHLITNKSTNSQEVEEPDDKVGDNRLTDTTKPKNKNSRSRNTQRKWEIAAKAIHDYSMNDVMQVARNFIHKRGEEWVNFTRVSQHLYETFYDLEPKRLGQPNKNYKTLLKFFADHSSQFDLRQDDAKSGLYWIRLKPPH